MSQLNKILKAFRHPKYAIYVASNKYIKWYEGFSYNFAENGEARLIKSLSRDSVEVVFDVGANVGRWSELALEMFPNATVHSFELSNTTFVALEEKLSSNNRIVLNNIGLSNSVGKTAYKDYGDSSGINTIIGDADFHDDKIEPTTQIGSLITGDQYCHKKGIERIDLLKIDVEGAEHLVLEGFRSMLDEGAIKVIQFEYGYTHADAKFLIKDFYNLLVPLGYLVGPLKPSGVLFMDFNYALNGFNSGPNFVAIHASCKDLIRRVQGKPIKGYPRI